MITYHNSNRYKKFILYIDRPQCATIAYNTSLIFIRSQMSIFTNHYFLSSFGLETMETINVNDKLQNGICALKTHSQSMHVQLSLERNLTSIY